MEPSGAKAFDHKMGGDDERCPVCTHPRRDILDKLYLDCEPTKDIANLAGDIDPDYVSVHGYATGLQKERLDNTEGLYGKMIGAYLNNFDPEKVTANQAIAAGRQLDLIKGRASADVHLHVPQRVPFVEMPPPTAGQDRKTEVIDSDAIEMLPPTAGDRAEEL